MEDLIYEESDVINDFSDYVDVDELGDDFETALYHIAQIQSYVNITMDEIKEYSNKLGRALNIEVFEFKDHADKFIKKTLPQLKLPKEAFLIICGLEDFKMSETRVLIDAFKETCNTEITKYALKQDMEFAHRHFMLYILH